MNDLLVDIKKINDDTNKKVDDHHQQNKETYERLKERMQQMENAFEVRCNKIEQHNEEMKEQIRRNASDIHNRCRKMCFVGKPGEAAVNEDSQVQQSNKQGSHTWWMNCKVT